MWNLTHPITKNRIISISIEPATGSSLRMHDNIKARPRSFLERAKKLQIRRLSVFR